MIKTAIRIGNIFLLPTHTKKNNTRTVTVIMIKTVMVVPMILLVVAVSVIRVVISAGLRHCRSVGCGQCRLMTKGTTRPTAISDWALVA